MGAAGHSGIWQPNDEHKFSATLDYYHKVNHSHYDTWNIAGTSIPGDAEQQSDTRRWGISLADEYTPDNGWIDSLTSRVYYQHTEAHDNTWLPISTTSKEHDYSDYNVDTWGFDLQGDKTLGRHDLSAGLNGRLTDTERPFRQDPTPGSYSVIMQPQADSRSITLGGFVQDKINFELGGERFALIPSVRAVWQQTKPQNLSSLTSNSTALADSSTDYMRVPGYGMVDMTAYWQATKSVKLSGGVYNLTDRKYWDYLSSRQLSGSTAQDSYEKSLTVMPGRTFQLGVNVNF